MASWLGLVDALALEGGTQLGEYRFQATVNVERARQSHRDCDFSRRPIVFEPQREQHAVRWIQLSEGVAKCRVALIAPNGRIRSSLIAGRYLVGVDFFGNQILEPPPGLLLVTAVCVVASRASVPLTKMIEYEPARDDDQPRRELHICVRSVGAQSAAVIFSKRRQGVGVRIHRRVVIARHRTTRVEHGLAVLGNEFIPGAVALALSGCILKSQQAERKNGRTCAFGRTPSPESSTLG